MGCSNRSYQAVILRLVIAGERVEEVDPAVAVEHEEGNEEQEDEVHEVGVGRSRLEAHMHTAYCILKGEMPLRDGQISPTL